uniref:Luciferase 6 n=1 Tax=Odontosyllis octodentata TaxID=2336528 RepID=A0A5A4Q7V0_9ANNE|nr:luciferase 6 [Odontosyllis octodentata]
MKVQLFLTIACYLLVACLSQRETLRTCARLGPDWSQVDCSAHQSSHFRLFDRMWAGDFEEVAEEWLANSAIPPGLRNIQRMAFCTHWECFTNQALINYMNIHRYLPQCLSQSPEDWVNDRYWARCVNQALIDTDHTADYLVYFCHKMFGIQEVPIPCPSDEVILSSNRPRIQDMQKAQEIVQDAEPETDQWWISLMRNIMELSVDENNVPTFHYGWIINKDGNDLKNMVPLWSPYQGPTVPVSIDFPKILNALDNGGDITLGGFRSFRCVHWETTTAVRCEEFGPLSYNPWETIVLVPTQKYILMGMTQRQDRVFFLEDALQKQADALISDGF